MSSCQRKWLALEVSKSSWSHSELCFYLKLYPLLGDTFDAMTSYLGLSSDVTSYFNDPMSIKFMKRLAEHPDVNEFRCKIQPRPADERIMSPVTLIQQLITMPSDCFNDAVPVTHQPQQNLSQRGKDEEEPRPICTKTWKVINKRFEPQIFVSNDVCTVC